MALGLEELAHHLIEKTLNITEKVDISCAAKNIIGEIRSKYWNIMDRYCDWIDKKWVSPNQIVTYRVASSIGSGIFLASGNHGLIWEAVGMSILGASLFHDAVDGHLARKTQQTSPEWETLDALGDKIVVFSLIAILICSLDLSPQYFYALVGASWVALLLDIKSQLLRNNNIEALKKSFQAPLNQEERRNNPNKKSPGAAVSAGKIKTALIMSGISLTYLEDILRISENNGDILLLSIITSCGLAIKSLHQKWVTFKDFFKL